MGVLLTSLSKCCPCLKRPAQAKHKEKTDLSDEEAGPLLKRSTDNLNKKTGKQNQAKPVKKDKKKGFDSEKKMKKSKEISMKKSKQINMKNSNEMKSSIEKVSTGIIKPAHLMKESIKIDNKYKGVKFIDQPEGRQSQKHISSKNTGEAASSKEMLESNEKEFSIKPIMIGSARGSVSEDANSRLVSKRNSIKPSEGEEEYEEEEKNDDGLELHEDEKEDVLDRDDFDDNYAEVLKEIDTLTENQQKEISRVFKKNKTMKPKKFERMDEELDVFVTVNKINRYNMSQKRVLLISTFAIYNVLFNDLNFVTNRLDLAGIDCLIYDRTGTQLMIKSKPDSGSKSIWFQSDKIFAIAGSVSSVYFQLYNDNLRKFSFSKKEMKRIYSTENFIDFLRHKDRENHDLFNKIEKKYSTEADKAGRVEALIDAQEVEIYEKNNFKSRTKVTILLSNIQIYILKGSKLLRKILLKSIYAIGIVLLDQKECILKIKEIVNQDREEYKTEDLIIKHIRSHSFCLTIKESIEKSLNKESREKQSILVKQHQNLEELRSTFESYDPRRRK